MASSPFDSVPHYLDDEEEEEEGPREKDMASTPVESVLHDLEFVLNDLKLLKVYISAELGCYDVRKLMLNLQCLKTFLLCARKWSNNYLYLELDDDKKVNFLSFVSSISDTVNLLSFLSSIRRTGNHLYLLSTIENSVDKNGMDETETDETEMDETEMDVTEMDESSEDSLLLITVLSKFSKRMKSFKLEMIKVYKTLLHYSSLQSSCWMSADELVDFIDSILRDLVNLLSFRQFFLSNEDYLDDLPSEIEALEDKLTFLKIFIGFAKLCCVEHGKMENLLTHIQFVALNAAYVSFLCMLYGNDGEDDEQVHSMCNMMSELLQKCYLDLQVYETYINILRASKSSTSLQTMKMDKHIVGDFNNSLISSLWELLLCDTSFMVSVKGQMQILYEGLRFFRSTLMKPHKQMDELEGKIVTILSEAGIIICSLYVNQVNKVDVDFSPVPDSSDCCAMLDDINSHIILVKTQIMGSSMTESLPSYQIFKGQEVRKTSSLMPSKGKIPITHEVVVELEDEANEVIDRLIGGSENLEIIPIVGMPGLGKTTLAKKLYNHASILHHFHIRLWCAVSQVYNIKNILLQILHDDDKCSGMNGDDLLQKLYKKLKGNKYLIVFDDVWDIKVWDDSKFSCPNDKNGSRILFTSRFSNVVSEVQIGREPHNLRSLTDNESWELLKKKVFGKKHCPRALHRLGMELAKICKGLPLTVVIVAGILATTEHEGWEEVAKSLTSTIVYETDQCKNTLELSYKYLPHYLKPCLLYFGAFPEDQEIRTKNLMWLWIAEGFVQNRVPQKLEDVAEEYMMDLVGRNLVMVVEQRSRGGVKACRIHDLLHEFCKAKAKEENFLEVLHGYDELSTFSEPPNLQRLSIWSKLKYFKMSRLFCPHSCSLLFFSKDYGWSMTADISFVFCIYKHLRVLDLEQIKLLHQVFSSEITLLVQLRYLSITGRSIRLIPPSIANLSELETFLVSSDFGTASLPDTIWNMKKLRHLHITGRGAACSLPSGNLENSSNLQNLDTFSSLDVSLEQSLEDILRKIPNVRRLEIKLSYSEKSFNRILVLDSLSQLESLESLKVLPLNRYPSHQIDYCFVSTLKELTLQKLCLPWCKLSLIEELPILEVLKLLRISFEGKRWDMKEGGFPKLRFLRLENVDVVEWTETDTGDYFPCLQKLELIGSDLKLEKIPSSLGSIPFLEMIRVSSVGNDTLKSLVREIEEKQISYGNENLKILIIN